jgi:hypothetical protein
LAGDRGLTAPLPEQAQWKATPAVKRRMKRDFFTGLILPSMGPYRKGEAWKGRKKVLK